MNSPLSHDICIFCIFHWQVFITINDCDLLTGVLQKAAVGRKGSNYFSFFVFIEVYFTYNQMHGFRAVVIQKGGSCHFVADWYSMNEYSIICVSIVLVMDTYAVSTFDYYK